MVSTVTGDLELQILDQSFAQGSPVLSLQNTAAFLPKISSGGVERTFVGAALNVSKR